jgi:predicted membrane-bound spermidine synthase
MQELHWVDSSQLFRVEVSWTPLATGVMSDLADAVFGGQLLGHVIAGQELTTSVIADAAMTADLASHMVVDDNLSTVEHEILQAKVAEQTIADGSYSSADIMTDMQSSSLADSLIS